MEKILKYVYNTKNKSLKIERLTMVLKYVNGKTMKENCHNVDDEYFTKPEIAKYCFEKAKEIIGQYDDLNNFLWIEPSAGALGFYNLLPANKRIGIDINPANSEIIEQDYLTYKLPKKKFVVIGNPPFGHRGVLALEFINYSSEADYVAFILPMFFMSVGKGSIRYRVKGLNLIHEEILSDDSFYLKTGKSAVVKCCFQIWSKNHSLETQRYNWYTNKKVAPYSSIAEVVTVSLAKKRECGLKWIYEKKADYYIASTFFKSNKVVYDFKYVKYKSGVAIILKTNDNLLRQRIDEALRNADWKKYSSKATNGCYHIGRSHIYDLLKDCIGEEYE